MGIPSKDELYTQHIENFLKLRELSDLFKLSYNQIIKLMHEYKIPIKKYSHFINITNQKYERLSVIKLNKFVKGKSYWECKCDCGEIVIVQSACLKNGKTKSCGCFKKDEHYIRNWKGYKEISGNYFGSLKRGAKWRNFQFKVTLKYIWELFLKQDRKCALTGTELKFTQTIKNKCDTTASLDRIDSKKGYIKGNVQWVHKDINKFKNNYDEKIFIDMCMQIADFKRKAK